MKKTINQAVADNCTATNQTDCNGSDCDIIGYCPRQKRNFKDALDLKTAMIVSLNTAFDQLVDPDFMYHSQLRPMLFIQEPFHGTHAMVFLKGCLHPMDTVKCMDVIYSHLQRDKIEGCLIANDLTTLEVNLDVI